MRSAGDWPQEFVKNNFRPQRRLDSAKVRSDVDDFAVDIYQAGIICKDCSA